MNLQAYANHRKEQGLRGRTHVAVLNAINDGRLSFPAVRKVKGRWVIDAALADAQWAGRTDFEERGARGGGAVEGPSSGGMADPTAKGVPNLAISKAVKTAYEAKLTQLEYQEKNGEMISAKEVKDKLRLVFREARDNLLGVAGRVAGRVAASSDVREVQLMIDEEIRVAIRVLADG